MPPYEIEKDVPLPSRNSTGRSRYPWAEMEVGDSFFAADGVRSRVAAAAQNHRRRYGRRFAVRVEGDGVRVWRIE